MNQSSLSDLLTTLPLLYEEVSKHSAYQSIPEFVTSAIGYQVPIQEEWRDDKIRWRYFSGVLTDPKLLKWCDFGANTGFFALTLAHTFPERQVLAIEANSSHARFIETVMSSFNLANLSIRTEAVTIDNLSSIPPQDVLLHLNVLHHAGMDFDKGRVSGPGDFMAYAEDYLHRLRGRTRTLVFQLGSNLWGDKSKPIVDHWDDATKLLLYCRLLIRSGWRIDHIAYASKGANGIEYSSLSETIVAHLRKELPETSAVQKELGRYNLTQHVGEFYRRPLFICTDPGAPRKGDA